MDHQRPRKGKVENTHSTEPQLQARRHNTEPQPQGTHNMEREQQAQDRLWVPVERGTPPLDMERRQRALMEQEQGQVAHGTHRLPEARQDMVQAHKAVAAHGTAGPDREPHGKAGGQAP